MDDKRQLIKDMVACTRRIVDKHIRIDEQPLRLDEEVSLSPREVRAVAAIGDGYVVNVTEVARHFHFTKSAASQLVARLARAGFVAKRVSDHSNKEVRLSLTPLGEKAHRLFSDMMRHHLEDLCRRLDVFSVNQVSTASVLLQVMENAVDERVEAMESGNGPGS